MSFASYGRGCFHRFRPPVPTLPDVVSPATLSGIPAPASWSAGPMPAAMRRPAKRRHVTVSCEDAEPLLPVPIRRVPVPLRVVVYGKKRDSGDLVGFATTTPELRSMDVTKLSGSTERSSLYRIRSG